MSMRRAVEQRTLCEVLREINDLHQEDNQHCRKIRYLLYECEHMAKKMSKKLYQYNKEWDSKFWQDNPDYERDLLKRLDEHYIVIENPSESSQSEATPIEGEME